MGKKVITAIRVDPIPKKRKLMVTIWRDEGIKQLGGYVRDYYKPTPASLKRLLRACQGAHGTLWDFGPEGFDWRIRYD